jgi:glycosyltransferase involved in cell wall biosynthesis
MTLTVVVTAFSDSRRYVNRLPNLRRQWISLRNQTDTDFQLVLVDNNSYDDVTGLCQEYFPHVTVEKYGVARDIAGGRQRGVLAAGTERVIVMDSDLIAYPTWIAHHKIFAELCPRAVGVGVVYDLDVLMRGRELIMDDPERIDYGALEHAGHLSCSSGPVAEEPPGILNSLVSVPFPRLLRDNFRCSNLNINKADFLRANQDNVSGWGYEDAVLGARLIYHGLVGYTLRNVICIHQPHRAGEDASHHEDCASARLNGALAKEKIRELIRGRELEFKGKMPLL